MADRLASDIVAGVQPVSIILDRFRRAAAVPASVGDDLPRELAPLFRVLDAIDEESELVRARAVEAAGRQVAAARAEAAEVLASARQRAEAERGWAETERRRSREVEARALLAEAEVEAGRIRERGAARAPELVAAVLACVMKQGR